MTNEAEHALALRYGRGWLPLKLPSDVSVTVIRKPEMPVLPDPRGAVQAALTEAVAAPSLAMLASQARSACIAICDITRPVPNHLFLRPMIETLLAAGLSSENICVLVATGLHRPNLGDELSELLGDDWVQSHVQVLNHDARNDAEHITLGRTPTRQTVVRLDRRLVEADLKIVTGLVEPHFMAGYSGGRKVIAPGLAHAETITTFHNADFMGNPAADNCNFDGNPLHEEQLHIVRMLGGALALNTVIDEQRRLSFVNFGEIVTSHQQAVDFVRQFCEVSVDRTFSTVVTCAAGYPLDKTYYQTIKGIVGGLNILAPGGDLIIASECSEGMGSAEFIDAQRRLLQQTPQEFLRELQAKPRASIDEWQTQLLVKALVRGQVQLYSDRLPSAASEAPIAAQRLHNLDDGIRASLQRHHSHSLALIPEGPYVIPFVRTSKSPTG